MTASTLDRWATARGEEIAAELAEKGIAVCPACIGPLHADGDCRFCAMLADPADRAMRGARTRLDCEDGRWYTAELQAADRETLRRFWLAVDLAGQDVRTPANACARCGREERGHGIRSHAPYRITDRHEYAAPTDRCRLLRMKARRDAADARLYRAVARRFEALGGAAK